MAKGNGAATKEKKPKKKRMTKDEKKSLIDGKIEELMSARKELGTAVIEWEEAHARAGELKKTMERRQALMNGIVKDIDDIRSGNFTPLLPFCDEKATGEQSSHIAGSLKFDCAAEAVGLAKIFQGNKRIVKAFADGGLETVKDLGEYTSSGKKVADLKGMGPGLGNIVTETMINFWSDNAATNAQE